MPQGVYTRKKEPWNKGKTGVYSEETLKKMRNRNPNIIPWIKGKTHSQAVRLKIKEARKRQVFPTETRLRMGETRRGEDNPHWRGGRWKNKDGYVFIFSPNHPYASRGYVFEHRRVAEIQIGRHLKREERVHHINKIRDDNRPENLMTFINATIHGKFENGEIVELTEIVFDGRKLLNI